MPPWLVQDRALMVTGREVATPECGECCEDGGGGGDFCCDDPGPCGTSNPYNVFWERERTLDTGPGEACIWTHTAECCPLQSPQCNRFIPQELWSGYPPRHISARGDAEFVDDCTWTVSGEAENEDGSAGCGFISSTNRLNGGARGQIAGTNGQITRPSDDTRTLVVANFTGTVDAPDGPSMATFGVSPTRWGNFKDCTEGRDDWIGSVWSPTIIIRMVGGFWYAEFRFGGGCASFPFMTITPSMNVSVTIEGDCISIIEASATAVFEDRGRDVRCEPGGEWIPARVVVTERIRFGVLSGLSVCPGGLSTDPHRVERFESIGSAIPPQGPASALQELREAGLV